MRTGAAPFVLAVALAVSGCAGSDAVGPSQAAAGGSAGSSTNTPALDFTATTLAAAPFDASTLRGQPVVLWFWAPWCAICRVEAPDVAAVAAELDGDVTFLGVPGRGPVADMRAFVDDTGTGQLSHLVDDDGSLWRRFEVVGQPAFAFVAADGSTEVFAGALGAEQLRERATALVAG